MTDGPIRVGIIGISPDPARSWATRAHVPALQHLPGYEITGVCTSKPETAKAAAEHFGVALAFNDPAQLAAHPDIDLVVVAVQGPLHRQMVEAIVAAGKAIYCEWPLGITLGEARALHDLTKRAGVPNVIGLQGSCNEVIAYAGDLIRDGFIGRMTALTCHSEAPHFGGRQIGARSYILDRANGVNLFTVAGGHALATLDAMVGGFASLSAIISTQYPETVIIETGETVAKTAPDQLVISGELLNGAVASLHLKGGAVRTAGNRIEINGTDGDLLLESSDGANIHRAIMTMEGGRGTALEPMTVPDSYALQPPGLPEGDGRAVGHVYAQFERAWRSGEGGFALDFDYAMRFHELLAVIERAAETGQRQFIA
jgi:predicted dehydrogenase